MLTYNDQTKARFPLSLDGRGVRGEGALAALLLGCVALLAAPGAALADNECSPVGVDPAVNPGPDSYVCDGPVGTYDTSGVTYTADGHLTVENTVNDNHFGGSGITLTGQGADNVSFLSGAADIQARGITGPAVNLSTEQGAILADVQAVETFSGSAAGVTHAIFAQSTDGGDIGLTLGGAVMSRNFDSPDSINIEAHSDGGDVSITTTGRLTARAGGIRASGQNVLIQTGGSISANSAVDGQFGVFAEAADALFMDLGGNVSTAGTAAVHAQAGDGGIELILRNGADGGLTGTAVRAITTGGLSFSVLGGTVTGALDFSAVSGGQGGVPLNFTGNAAWNAGGSSFISDFDDEITLGGGTHGLADSAVINLAGGNDTLSVTSTMNANAGTIDFGAGNDVMNVSGDMSATGTLIDMGAGDDAFNLSGTVSVFDLMTVTNAASFDHGGVLNLSSGSVLVRKVGDVFRLTGGSFTGSGDARVVMDVTPGNLTQAGCDAALVAGDCVDLRGASTAGTTALQLRDINQNEALLGQYTPEGIVLVDVRGAGSTAAGHFAISPDSTNYVNDPVYGGALERPGLFRYTLVHDDAGQQHRLVGMPRAEVLEYAVLGSAAHSIWHMTGEAVTDRQTDLRGARDGSLWLRVTRDYGSRDQATVVESLGNTFSHDTSYGLEAEALMGGVDLVSGSSNGTQHALGVQMGYVRARADLKTSPSAASFTGATLGAYGSLWSDRFFLDGALHTNFLALDYESSGLGLKTTTRLESIGAHAEGGMRFEFAGRYFAEPLATVAWVNTTFEEISLFGGEILPDDSASLRGALGLRLGAEWNGEHVDGNYFVTGRAWNEFDGESGVVVQNPGPDVPLTDDFSGSFRELGIGLSVHNKANTLSGYLSAGWKDKDDYDATNFSAGVRWRW